MISRDQIERPALAALRSGLLQAGLASARELPPPGRRGMGWPLRQRLLGLAAQHLGEEAVFLAGRAPPQAFVDEVLRRCLLASPSPALLFEKLDRLQGMMGVSRRERVQELGPVGALVEHQGAGEPAEVRLQALLMAGVLASLLRGLGCEGLRVRFPMSQEPRRELGLEEPLSLVPGGRLTLRHFTWTSFEHPGAAPALPGLTPPEEGPPTLRALEHLVLADPARRWRVSDAARALGRSPRALQRDLAEQGSTFSEAVERVRLDLVRHALLHTRLSVGDMALLFGFSDATGLSRRCRERWGQSPGRWRVA